MEKLSLDQELSRKKPLGEMTALDNLLAEREKTHGSFRVTAYLADGIKMTYRESKSFQQLSPVLREALDLIATKLARILSGDFEEREHWNDIAGYAILAARTLQNHIQTKAAAKRGTHAQHRRPKGNNQRKPSSIANLNQGKGVPGD